MEREGGLGGLRGSEGGRGHGREGFVNKGGCVGSRDHARRSVHTASLRNDDRPLGGLVEISEAVVTARGECRE